LHMCAKKQDFCFAGIIINSAIQVVAIMVFRLQ
jgi:hypothetical protein